ncbi:MAG: hypothetical protein IT538_13675 [Variibacter sp.]|nr:hypothetical protein [Variibacter sp.]
MQRHPLSHPLHLSVSDGLVTTLEEAADLICGWQQATDIELGNLCSKLRSVRTAEQARDAEREFISWAEGEGILLAEPEEVPLIDDAREAQPIPAPDMSASGDDETIDGLNQTEEALRVAAEDVPGGRLRKRPSPVFDRAQELD